MKNVKRTINAFLVSLVALLIVATPILASDIRTIRVNVSNNTAIGYAMYPVLVDVDNAGLVTSGYISADGLNVWLENAGSTIPSMIADDKTLLAMPLSALTSYIPYMKIKTTSNTYMSIIPGYDGYITTSDAAALEPGNNFEVEISGYFDTSAAGKYILKKDGALEIYTSGAGEFTGSMLSAMPPFNPSSAKNITYLTNASYAAARTTATGDAVADNVRVGQDVLLGWFNVWRSFLIWDTSSIPDGATITAATINLSGITDSSTTDFTITVTNGQPTYPHNPVITGDFDYSKYAGSGGTLTTVGIGATANIDLDATGISWISKTSSTKLALQSSRDISATEPAGAEWIAATGATLTLTYENRTDVVAAGITSGVHTIKLKSDGTDLKIYDGATEKGSTALNGASCVGNANDFIWLNNNSCPYATYIKYTVGGVLLITYQPVAIISGTTLPDTTGAAQNGAFTWGANSADIDASLGNIVITSVSGATPTSTAMPNILPTMDSSPEDGTLFSNPFTAVITALVNIFNTTIGNSSAMNATWVWCFISMVIIEGLMIIILKKLQSQLAAGLIGLFGMGIAMAFNIWNFWMLFIFAISAIALILMERKQSI